MIKNGEFCIYNDNEYELNEDSDGNLIIITTNRAIIDETFVDKYNSGVYSKVILPNEIGEAYDCQTYGVIKGSRVNVEKENEEYYKILYNNKMVGFIGIKNYEKEIYLYRFFIDEKYRNNGVGTIALNQIIELAKVQNKDLSLEVIGENIARDLYERLGFKTHYRRMILKINDDIYEN